MVDVPYLRKALEHITDHPEEWNQRHYGGTGDVVANLVLLPDEDAPLPRCHSGGEIIIPDSVKETKS